MNKEMKITMVLLLLSIFVEAKAEVAIVKSGVDAYMGEMVVGENGTIWATVKNVGDANGTFFAEFDSIYVDYVGSSKHTSTPMNLEPQWESTFGFQVTPKPTDREITGTAVIKACVLNGYEQSCKETTITFPIRPKTPQQLTEEGILFFAAMIVLLLVVILVWVYYKKKKKSKQA